MDFYSNQAACQPYEQISHFPAKIIFQKVKATIASKELENTLKIKTCSSSMKWLYFPCSQAYLGFPSRLYNLSLSLEIMQGASLFKEGICASWQLPEPQLCLVVKISRVAYGLCVISICTQTAGLHFVLFAFNNKPSSFGC